MKQLSVENAVITLTGKVPGKTVVVFGAIHGNERVGVEAMNALLREGLQPVSGIVHFVLANPHAYAAGVRQKDVNLNRIFSRDTGTDSPEEKRAHELMDILDTADALLDIHAFNSPVGPSFIIGDVRMRDYAKKFPFPIFSYGWGELEPGDTCDYMYAANKPALCMECGPVSRFEEFIPLAKDSIRIFLASQGIVDGELPDHAQKAVRVHTIGTKKSDDFRFAKDYAEFEPLAPGQPFAYDGDEEHVAGEGDVIIFPRPNKPVGGEVFLLGTYTE